MTCFELIRTVLDELYYQIPIENEEEKDAAIAERLRYLRSQYGRLQTGANIDYSDPVTRFAYVYCYVTCHANMVLQLLEAAPELQQVLSSGRTTISCLGGGPGSEYLGIAKYLIQEGKTSKARFSLYDREPTWGETWNGIDAKLEEALEVSNLEFRMPPIFFQPLDVTQSGAANIYTRLLGTDLFTLIYFISEVYGVRQSATQFFTGIFNKAKRGALVLFIDNNASPFVNWFDDLAAMCGLQQLYAGAYNFRIGSEEEKQDLGRYLDKWTLPKLTANAAYRICRKQ